MEAHQFVRGRASNYFKSLLTDDSEVVSLKHWPHFMLLEDSWKSFLLEVSRPYAIVATGNMETVIGPVISLE